MTVFVWVDTVLSLNKITRMLTVICWERVSMTGFLCLFCCLLSCSSFSSNSIIIVTSLYTMKCFSLDFSRVLNRMIILVFSHWSLAPDYPKADVSP